MEENRSKTNNTVEDLPGYEKVINYKHEVLAKPLVSIIVNVYNHGKYLRDCLDGILNQQVEFSYELLLGEDGSSDNSRDICIEYANKYPTKIRLFLHDRSNVILINNSPTGRYNLMYSMLAANGKYFALCPGDDYWINPLKLQTQVSFLEENNDYNFSIGKVKVLKQNSGVFFIRREARFTKSVRELTVKHYIKANIGQTSTYVFRNNFRLPDWFKEVYTGDKAIVTIATGDKKIKFHNEIFSVYRQHRKGMSSRIKKDYKKLYQNEKHLWNNLKKLEGVRQFSKLVDLRIKESYYLYKENTATNFISKSYFRLIKIFSILIRSVL